VGINACDASTNQTLLNIAAGEGNINVMCLLIEQGAEVDSHDKLGCTDFAGFTNNFKKQQLQLIHIWEYQHKQTVEKNPHVQISMQTAVK
jgi:ankyrin repeat protein